MLFDDEKSLKMDLRVRKTERALISSMQLLLMECPFTKLTVDRLCKQGQISRATFYAHFMDKYDLLEFWLPFFWTHKIAEADDYEKTRERINQFVSENKMILKNLLIDADQQTIEIMQNFLCSALGVDYVKRVDGKIVQKNIVAANLYVGGIVQYLVWQARNNFPADVPAINKYSFSALKKLWDWAKEQ